MTPKMARSKCCAHDQETAAQSEGLAWRGTIKWESTIIKQESRDILELRRSSISAAWVCNIYFWLLQRVGKEWLYADVAE